MIMQKKGKYWEKSYIYTCLKMRKSIDKKRLACIIKKVLTMENEKSFVEELKCELVWDTMFTN